LTTELLLTQINAPSDVYLEEYSPDIRYIKGENNIVADALSRLELSDEPMEEAFFTDELRSEFYAYGAEAMQTEDYALTYAKIGKAQSKSKQFSRNSRKRISSMPYNNLYQRVKLEN
jgi:hypothetical protein